MKTKTLLAAMAMLLAVGVASAQQKDTKSCCKEEKCKTCVCVDKDGNKACKKDAKGVCKSEACKCYTECSKDSKATCCGDKNKKECKNTKKCNKTEQQKK